MKTEVLQTIWVISPEEVEAEREWITQQVLEIGDDTVMEMGEIAVKKAGSAYKEYSGYPVGAAVLCDSGEMYGSFNAEVVVWDGSGHAENKAVWRAMDDDEHIKSGRKFVKAVAVAHEEGGGDNWSGPCGICLQHIIEHCDNALILVFDLEGKLQHTTSLKTLMPRPFTPSHLGID